MRRFEEEIKSEYPEWFQTTSHTPQKVVKHVHVHTKQPLYVLPMIFTLCILGLFASAMYIQNKNNCAVTYQTISHLEKQINTVENKVQETCKHMHLVALLHNENFASVRQATGNQNLIFINKDWKIDKMPIYLNLSDEHQEYIKNEHFNIDKDQPKSGTK